MKECHKSVFDVDVAGRLGVCWTGVGYERVVSDVGEEGKVIGVGRCLFVE